MTPEEFAQAASVSDETLERLKAMDRVLTEWTERHNLIARSTLPDRWERHFLDSIQLVDIIGDAPKRLVDIGSGAGFPGLILAAHYANQGTEFTLIESTGKKAAFLREAAIAMGLKNVTVLAERIEQVKLRRAPDMITARALANLNKLLGYAHHLAGADTRFVFPKGQDVENELKEASIYWQMSVNRHKSRTSPSGTILEIGKLRRV